ncbi:MAG: CBS domain-containing protein [Anaerolineaceae bacterium]
MTNRMVRNWMSSPVVSVSPETNLTEARTIMDERQIRALPVVKEGKLVGIITKRGLLRLDLSILETDSVVKNVELAEETVGEVMSLNPITLDPGMLLPKAARMMLENKITALPVVEDGKLVGILTNSDLLRFILSEFASLNKDIRVKDYMTDEVVTIDEETTLLEAHRLMSTKRIRSLPVMENKKLMGLVTRTDLMSSDPSRLVTPTNQEILLKLLTLPVKKVMSKKVLSISPEAEITTAARLLLENKIHVLVVLNAEKKLLGVLTESDLFLMIVQKFS